MSKLYDKVFRIEGERATLNGVIRHYGSKYPIKHVDTVANDAVKTLLQVIIERGQSLVVEQGAATDNTLWPGHAWKGIKEVLGL